MDPTRRSVIGAIAGLAAASAISRPAYLRAETPVDTDIVIIGAGAAGLAAARTFRHHGIRFILLEARERIGGRAQTDSDIFGVPVDLGCAEIHNGRFNPWVQFARRAGFDVAPLPPASANAIYDGHRPVEGREADAVAQEFRRHQRALLKTCRGKRDVSAASVLESLRPRRWSASVRNWLGPISDGIDTDRLSTLDWCSGATGEDWFSPAGFGALISHYGREIPVTLNAPVSGISLGPTRVDVQSARGTASARLALITVPVGVLAAESIVFAPVLPAWKRDAIAGMDMNDYLRVLLQIDAKALGRGPGSWLAYRTDDGRGFSFWVDPGGHGVTHAIAGGSFARELEFAGNDVSADLAMDALAGMFGSAIRRSLKESIATVWSQDPFSRGAWAVARPGHAASRKRLVTPVGGRLYFAGEADHEKFHGTAGGAAIAGSIVARRMAERLRPGSIKRETR